MSFSAIRLREPQMTGMRVKPWLLSSISSPKSYLVCCRYIPKYPKDWKYIGQPTVKLLRWNGGKYRDKVRCFHSPERGPSMLVKQVHPNPTTGADTNYECELPLPRYLNSCHDKVPELRGFYVGIGFLVWGNMLGQRMKTTNCSRTRPFLDHKSPYGGISACSWPTQLMTVYPKLTVLRGPSGMGPWEKASHELVDLTSIASSTLCHWEGFLVSKTLSPHYVHMFMT